jgi:hypothetical protein
VILLWPMLAARIKDPELTMRKLGSSLFWGSAYNIPMMAPVTVQIIKTTASRIAANFSRFVLGKTKTLKEEFVVTPKTVKMEKSLHSVASKLRAELAAGISIIFVAAASEHPMSLIFAAPQVLSAISLPVLVYMESKGSRAAKSRTKPLVHIGRTPYYAPYLNYEKLPSPAIQKSIR